MTALDFESMSLASRDHSRDQVKSDIEDMPCPVLFAGHRGKRYLATMIALGQWIGGRVICEMIDERRVGRCGIYSFASEGGGRMWKSSAGDYVVIGDARTETNAGGFMVVALADGKLLAVDDPPHGLVIAAALDSGRQLLMTVSDVEGLPGAAEVSAYHIEAGKAGLIGRRSIEPPYDGSIGPGDREGDKSQALRPKFLLNDGAFIISMMPGTLIAVDVAAPLNWFEHIAEIIRGRIGPRKSLPDTAISIVWSAQQLDLGEGAVADVVARAGSRVLMARVGSKIRLYAALDGVALTPPIDLPSLDQRCGSNVRSAVIENDESLTINLEGCRVRRMAPQASESMASAASSLEAYFTIDPAGARK